MFGFFFLSKAQSLIFEKKSHTLHARLRRTFSHGMYPDLEKIKPVEKIEMQNLKNLPKMPLAFILLVLCFRNRLLKVFNYWNWSRYPCSAVERLCTSLND